MPNFKTLRLILGDQLNINHQWFKTIDANVTYVLMEIKSETDYTTHHIQKITGFFASMRQFAKLLSTLKHNVIYIKINDINNKHSFAENLDALIKEHNFKKFEYQLPDEYRVDKNLKDYKQKLNIETEAYDSEHFFADRLELGEVFKGKKQFLMETFYRGMRKKHQILMQGDTPLFNQWNFDSDNRSKLPKNHKAPPPLVFKNNVEEIYNEILASNIKFIGTINPKELVWPINRKQALELYNYFIKNLLQNFGTFQDAMAPGEWSLYHSRISYAMNIKLISPKEVIDTAYEAYKMKPDEISFNQLEGFVRQILGWREYMRGIYWLKMPEYRSLNFFNHNRKLPNWYWTGNTKMACMHDSISQSLTYAYAHHIQRLMITGNFALLAGIHPDEVDTWYLGIYIDALEWVEITNTRGMSQFADGGIVGTKPYVSSAAYIDKMSHYCGKCFYNKSKKFGEKACPFNSLHWHFYNRNEKLLGSNPRLGMIYNVWRKMKQNDKSEILKQAEEYLKIIEDL